MIQNDDFQVFVGGTDEMIFNAAQALNSQMDGLDRLIEFGNPDNPRYTESLHNLASNVRTILMSLASNMIEFNTSAESLLDGMTMEDIIASHKNPESNQDSDREDCGSCPVNDHCPLPDAVYYRSHQDSRIPGNDIQDVDLPDSIESVLAKLLGISPDFLHDSPDDDGMEDNGFYPDDDNPGFDFPLLPGTIQPDSNL